MTLRWPWITHQPPSFERARAPFGLVLLITIVLNGCALPPVEQFEGYSRAMEQVRDATYVLVSDYEAALAEQRSDDDSGQPPDEFSLEEARKRTGNGATDQRRRAVDAVVLYNEAMLALAAGRSVESVKAYLAPISQALNFAAPQFGFGGSLVEGLVGRALQAQDNATFIAAFEDATIATRDDVQCAASPAPGVAMDPSCAPIIPAILNVLAADTETYYALQHARYTSAQSAAADDYFEAGSALVETARASRAPAEGSAAARDIADIEQEMTEIGRRITPDSREVKLDFGSRGRRFDADTLSAMQALMIPLRSIGKRASANRDALNEYHDALAGYVVLIDRTLVLLSLTEEAAKQPPDVIGTVARLATIRAELEADAIGTRAALLRAIAAVQGM